MTELRTEPITLTQGLLRLCRIARRLRATAADPDSREYFRLHRRVMQRGLARGRIGRALTAALKEENWVRANDLLEMLDAQGEARTDEEVEAYRIKERKLAAMTGPAAKLFAPDLARARAFIRQAEQVRSWPSLVSTGRMAGRAA